MKLTQTILSQQRQLKPLSMLNLLTNHFNVLLHLQINLSLGCNGQGIKQSLGKQEDSTFNRFNAGVYVLPHIQKRHKGGEDAAVLTDRVLAVADGVGGWAENNVDPAKYSRRLCQNIVDLVFKNDDRYKVNPKELLTDAVYDNKEVGSCTCVIAILDEEKPYIYTANLGDSGFLILRKEGLDLISRFRSKEQQHSFNFPFQVGTGGDDPNKADGEIHEIQNGDIIILASDGLWDNMYDVKIVDIVRPFIRDQDELADPELVAELIATQAEKFSNQQNYFSPFAKGARDNFYDFNGGKPDDITVIVGQVILRDSKKI
ncbi:serine threonine family 2c [Stylonychia lemnae]|uniref:Protein phosphatase n=1 Tax=Stylonychia lemnae TaxID=5949 RepID=A0A077ZRF8_STYLE|nr:serine threonine family 2c [Stylonychia lemnae]|eukprot:CDW72503.1 serine threonine family 2c [Stylonychia lemnae]